MTAVILNNAEVVHLCLGNNALNDPDRADCIFGQSAHSSNNEIFRQVLNHRDDWSDKNLMHGLSSCWGASDDRVANANDILDYWIAHEKVLDADDIYSATHAFEGFLKSNKVDLAGRILGILPDAIPFRDIQDTLLQYSCPQYNYRGDLEKAGVLTEEHRNALIAKSTRPSLKQVKEYYGSIGSQLKNNETSENYRETHFDTLNRLLDLAQLPPDEIGEFIASTFNYDEFAFIEPLVEKYEGQLTPRSKVKILERLFPFDSNRLALHEKRAQLFASWMGKWKNDVSAQAHQLYADISGAGKSHIEIARRRFQMYPSAARDYPSIEQLRAVNDRFKQILLETFPGCDQAPQAEAV